MSGTRLARGLFAFQLPTILAAAIGVALELADGGRVEGVAAAFLAIPMAVAMLLGSLITWGLEARRPLAARGWTARLARYQLPAFLVALLPMSAYAWLAGALLVPHFQWQRAFAAAGILAGSYLVIAALPIVFLARWGAVTPTT